MFYSGLHPVKFGLRWSEVDGAVASRIQKLEVTINYDPAYGYTGGPSRSDAVKVAVRSRCSGVSETRSFAGYDDKPGIDYFARIEWTVDLTTSIPPRSSAFAAASYAERHLGQTYLIERKITITDLPCSGFMKSPHHSNVCFIFPRDGRQLWGNAETLASASPYLKLLLQSGFDEGQEQTEAPAPKGTGKRLQLPFDDSDDEEALPALKESLVSSACTYPRRAVEITQASYVTYMAVLCWICTDFIDWAPLSSTFSDPTGRAKALAVRKQREPNLPAPASPKSVYRLAHLLELPKLTQLALDAITSQLTVDNIIQELFSETSGDFEDVRELLVSFAINNRVNLRTKATWGDIEGRFDEMPWAGKIALRLARSGL
ncbi:hypothetical protein P7C70_g3131, partial [Phenoliferia sp. Uapishka_3]